MSSVDATPAPRRVIQAIVLDELDAASWRVCDPTVAPDDARHVLGYVERVGSGFDVVWLRGAPRVERLKTLHHVRIAARRRTATRASSGPTRPVPIPHFEPPAR